MATFIPIISEVPAQFVDLNGDTLVNGTLEFYRAGTTTPTNMYTDAGVSIGTSITLNAWGMPESGGNTIALFRDQSRAVKIVGKNAAGATIYTADNIPAVASFDADSSTKLAGIEEGADVTDATNVGAVVNGIQHRYFSVEEMYPETASGCAALATTELTAGRPEVRSLDFDPTTREYAQWTFAFPNRYDLSTVNFQAYWSHASGNTAGLDGVAWGLSAVAISADEGIDTFFGTEIVVGVDSTQSADDLWVSAKSAAVTIAGSPADSDLVWFRISRVTGSTSPLDDLDIDAKLLGIRIYWTSDTLNDA